MAEIKAKVVLKTKGHEAYIPLKQMMVSLKWSSAVDLDLMAFYKAKDGPVGDSDRYYAIFQIPGRKKNGEKYFI